MNLLSDLMHHNVIIIVPLGVNTDLLRASLDHLGGGALMIEDQPKLEPINPDDFMPDLIYNYCGFFSNTPLDPWWMCEPCSWERCFASQAERLWRLALALWGGTGRALVREIRQPCWSSRRWRSVT